MTRAMMKAKRKRFIWYLEVFLKDRYYKGNGVTSFISESDDPIFGWNCSGLLSEGLRGVGMIGHRERLSVLEIYKRFADKAVNSPPIKGDILFYGTMKPGAEPELVHVAAMLDDYHIIEAGGGNGSVDTDEEAAKKNAFVRIRPVEFRESERVAICRIWQS